MATILVMTVAVAVVVVGTALGLVRHTKRRIAVLEHELDDVYQAQAILDRARTRKDRKHLHLLALVPIAWLARSSHARLAAATGLSAALVGVGFTATDNPTKSPLHPTPPAAAAETLENTPAAVDTPAYSYGTPPALQYPSTTSTTVAAEIPHPPVSAVVEAGSAPTEPPPSTVPTPSTTTTTTVTLDVEVPRVCLTPAITILDTCTNG